MANCPTCRASILRPTWFLDIERDGEVVPLVLRGDRTDSEAFPLRHEYTFHQLLEERDSLVLRGDRCAGGERQDDGRERTCDVG